jgi:hypothetical protein
MFQKPHGTVCAVEATASRGIWVAKLDKIAVTTNKTWVHACHTHTFFTTSRKHGKKESQSFVHCSSFDHLDLQSLNDCKFFFFGLPTEFLGIWGLLIYRWKGLENTFPTVYYMPPKV